jgi:hypothetical protein
VAPAPRRAAARDRDAGAALALLAAAALKEGARGPGYAALKADLRAAVTRDPFDAALVTVFGGALLFYLAEKGHNPKVTSYWDGLVFVSTCLSVGYADVFARTPAGKAIAAAIMTVGPALSGSIFDDPARGADTNPELLAIEKAILGKLDAILIELRGGPTRS